MKVLIAHDRDDARAAILTCLLGIGLESTEIDHANDYVEAQKCLSQNLYDLLIVDLTLPHVKGKSVGSYTTTQNLLLELFELDSLNTPGDIIGITKEPAALSSIDADIGQHLMMVLGETDADKWQELLSDKVNYIRKSSTARQRNYGQHYEYDVVILTALDKEMAPFDKMINLSPLLETAGAHEFIFSDKNGGIKKGLTYSIDRAGIVSAASVTQSLIARYRPRLVLMSGFCGGFADKNVNHGDLIFFRSMIDWDNGRWGDCEDPKWFPRPDPISIATDPVNHIVRSLLKKKLGNHNDIAEEAQKLSGGKILNFGYKAGPMASGSSLVAHKETISQIVKVNDKALGVDMESYGLAYACRNTPNKKPAFLVVKSVSDFADVTKDKKIQVACSFISASAVKEIITSYYDFDVQ